MFIAPLAHLNEQIIQFYNKINIDEMLNIKPKQCEPKENVAANGV